MTTYNTGNPIGSTAVKDLYDNAENLDTAVNTRTAESWDDRFGVARKTWWGMERQFDADQDDRDARFNTFLASSGYQFLGDYAAGIEITEHNQIVRGSEGEFWRLSGQVELPYTTTGDWAAEESLFVAVGDAALRRELADPDMGATMVARATIYVDSVADMQALNTAALKDGQVVISSGYYDPSENKGIVYRWSPSAPQSENNGMTVIAKDAVFDGSESGHLALIESSPTGAGCFLLCGLDKRKALSSVGVTPLSNTFGRAVEILSSIGVKLLCESGQYTLEKTVNAGSADIEFEEGFDLDQSDYTLSFSGNAVDVQTLLVDANIDENTIQVPDGSKFQPGSIIELESDALSYPLAREYDLCYQINQVVSVSGNTLTVANKNVFQFNVSDSAKLTLIDPATVTLKGPGSFVYTGSAITDGISIKYAFSPFVEGLKPKGFRWSGVYLERCYSGVVTRVNAQFYDSPDDLNYGIVIFNSFGIHVKNNPVISTRTAIDLSRLSYGCDVYENSVTGSINTHTAHYCRIHSNTISDGDILVRGPHNVASRNKIIRTSVGLAVEEAGLDGPVEFSFNEIHGAPSIRLGGGTRFINNHVYCTEVPSAYNSITSMVRYNPGNHNNRGELCIKDNEFFNLTGSELTYCIDANTNNPGHSSAVIEGNVFSGAFGIDINLAPTQLNSSDYSKISGNRFSGQGSNFRFRFANNLQITDNYFVGSVGVQMSFGGTNTDIYTSAIIAGNIFDGCQDAVESVSYGSAQLLNSLIVNNVYQDVTNKLTGDKFVAPT